MRNWGIKLRTVAAVPTATVLATVVTNMITGLMRGFVQTPMATVIHADMDLKSMD